MTIATVCAAIKTIMAGLSAVTINGTAYTWRAFDPPPDKLDTANLPAVYTFTGGAADDVETFGDDYVGETRQYRVQVAVLPTGQATPTLIEEHYRALVAPVKAALHGRPSLGLYATSAPHRVIVTGDSGPIALAEYQGFIGFNVTLLVTEVVTRTFANYE